MALGWRIIKSKYASSAIDGEGSRLHGSRWTSPGFRVVHASQSLSLATLEVLVHLQSSALLSEYAVFAIEVPDDCVEVLDSIRLPDSWRLYPAPVQLRRFGDAWIKNKTSVALRVPSAIIVQEHNYLINPEHQDFYRIKIKGPEPLDVDQRVFRRSGDA